MKSSINSAAGLGFRCWLALVSFSLLGRSAEPPITEQDLPRIPAVEPAKALSTFRIKPGFHLELVASEPDIASPVALCFDERGRMYVVEMIDYSERREQIPHLGRIKVLEDTDGDGTFDRSTVYADNLPWPTGVFYYDGGIFVIANPDILYLKDTKGTGHADQREVVFTGFSEGVTRVNVQEMPNSLIWGLDNRIHGATSGNGGKVRALRHPESGILNLNGHDFAIEPRTMTISAEAGGGQHGVSFDNFGRRFTCNNSDHIRVYTYDERYAGRNPEFLAPPSLQSIAVDGPAAEVYRISAEEPWRVVRTRWRIAGVLSGPVEGGGRSSGYFTGATGITIYRGNAFPSEYVGDAFIGECAFNLVHRKKLVPTGATFKAERPGDEQTVEFLASTDNWCRPVQFANAPDGTLYVMDMYREIVEHPWSLPDSIKKHLDLNSGSNRGRIYRIVPDRFKQPAQPKWDKANTAELVELLAHPNGWHRDTAARLIYERQDKAAVPSLKRLAARPDSVLGRLHALYALEGLSALDEPLVIAALRDLDPNIREHALKLSEKLFRDGIATGPLWTALRSMVDDSEIRVRYQLAFTIGELRDSGRVDVLERIAKRDAADELTRTAILASTHNAADVLFTRLGADSQFLSNTNGQQLLVELAETIGARNNRSEIATLLKALEEAKAPGFSFAVGLALGQGLQRAGSSLLKLEQTETVKNLFSHAAAIASAPAGPDALRVQAARFLGLNRYEDSRPVLKQLLSSNSEGLQTAAVNTLAHYAEPTVAPDFLEALPNLCSTAKNSAIAAMMSRPERIRVLLGAISSKAVPTQDLTVSQIKNLRNHRDAEIRRLAVETLGAEDARPRAEIVTAFQDALSLKGDAAHGKAIYLERCATCHKLENNGYAVGPDLVTVRSNGREKILTNILDPNREVAPQYIAFEIERKDGESVIGIIAAETTTTISVRQAQARMDVISRTEIKRMRSLGQSIMPEGLEQGLKPQDFADVLEYILTAKTP